MGTTKDIREDIREAVEAELEFEGVRHDGSPERRHPAGCAG